MVQIATVVEGPFYVVIASIVAFVAIFWFVLNHDKTLLLPFVGSTVFVLALSLAIGFFGSFFISLPSMMMGLTLHLLLAAWLSRLYRMILRR